jgi:type II secretory pathway component GspD/PulD (secretin)
MRTHPHLRSAAAAGVILLAASAALAQAVGVRIFQLRYRRAEEATLVVRPLLSDQGSILIQPKSNALTITDRDSALNAIARTLADFDRPPRNLLITVKMVRAQAEPSAGSPPKEIGEVESRLKEMFRFNAYSLVDSAVLHGSEGDIVSTLLGGDYRIAFRVDPSAGSSTIHFSQFQLARERTDEKGRKFVIPLYSTSLNVLLNQTLVLGASKEEGSKNALILVLYVQESKARPAHGPAEARR